MDGAYRVLAESEPKIVRRQCGGWLAVSPPSTTLRIGVTADTEEEVRAQFRRARDRWAEIILSGRPTSA